MSHAPDPYLLAGQTAEFERLRLQSLVWEPAGRALLATLPLPADARALDVGCGMLGWLRVLSEKLGPAGEVTGSDFDDKMLAGAADFVAAAALPRVRLVKDDLFASQLAPHSFDLVHARFQLAPLGRVAGQLAAYHRLLKPGGWLVLEDPDTTTWTVTPEAPATRRLIALIADAFRAGGGDLDAGRTLAPLLRERGGEPDVRKHVVPLPAGHPYLQLPLQFATSLRPRLERLVGAPALDALVASAAAELARPETHGTTFTLVQAWARLP